MNQTCIKLILNVCHANSNDRNHGLFRWLQSLDIPVQEFQFHHCELFVTPFVFVGVVICLFVYQEEVDSQRQMYHHIPLF